MAWYTSHTLRYRGRLVQVTSRYGGLQSATVIKGKPLDLGNVEAGYGKLTRDAKRLNKLFYRDKTIRQEINDFISSYMEDGR